MKRADVIVVGGGLAGLACAGDLIRAGRDVLLLEGSDGVGGRVRTDEVDGFLLDHGFQVLLEAYPECRERLDYAALDLRSFVRGAKIRVDGTFHRLVDPREDPLGAFRAASAPVGSMADKVRLAQLRSEVRKGDPADLLADPAPSTIDLLTEWGFGEEMIERFFRPFFGGVLLDPELEVSGRLFRYYLRMFADGSASIPARGMGRIPEQLAAALPEGVVRTGVRVRSVEPGEVTTDGGDLHRAEVVVVATEGPAAARLLDGRIADPGSRAVTCHYYRAPEPPVDEPILVLNGEGPQGGPINNLAVLSSVSPGYAPDGQSLISATVLEGSTGGGSAESPQIRQQLRSWFGAAVEHWSPVRSYRIEHAQPRQHPSDLEPARRPVRLDEGLFVCGDHRDNASLNGAVASGARAAEAVLEGG